MFAYECVDHADRLWSPSVLSSPHRASLRWRRMGASAPSGACITMMGQEQSLHAAYITTYIALQRHFRVLTKFAHVESRLSGRKRQKEVVFYTPVILCDRRPCSTSVAVAISPVRIGCTCCVSLHRSKRRACCGCGRGLTRLTGCSVPRRISRRATSPKCTARVPI